MSLTDTAVRNAKPTGKAIKLTDSGGLYLYVSPNRRISSGSRPPYRFFQLK
ncbi:hypothetical protein CHELA40_13682 [Chelatococcus asaccharovorans]|nr:hypothetical protein CHELA40_13682 [Chelatococcus asaccharovorans]CAH1676358.1 hypothetical protein CHELA17_61944 [Chelatococcus asaccharovorans]